MNNIKEGYCDIFAVIKGGIYIRQLLSQPSPSIKFPSSHCSVPLAYPSPQIVWQLLYISDHGGYQPSHKQLIWQGYIVHVDEQPSWSIRFPSSHSSIPLVNPSLQTVVQELFDATHGATHPSHKQLKLHGYNLQVDEHPSWSFVFPSSHSSSPTFIPSPHKVEHVPFIFGRTHPLQTHACTHVIHTPSDTTRTPEQLTHTLSG